MMSNTSQRYKYRAWKKNWYPSNYCKIVIGATIQKTVNLSKTVTATPRSSNGTEPKYPATPITRTFPAKTQISTSSSSMLGKWNVELCKCATYLRQNKSRLLGHQVLMEQKYPF